MRNHFALGHRLPYPISSKLFGDRRRYGGRAIASDPTWVEWQALYVQFYLQTQKQGIGNLVNRAGYRILGDVDFSGKTVCEIGPGDLFHLEFWKGMPERYILVDTRNDFLERAAAKLAARGVRHETVLVPDGNLARLPLESGSVDLLVSFYSLEHLYPLGDYLDEMIRVMKPAGALVGAIPTEGGLAWGTGRFLTSRRWLKRNSGIDPDKLVCWEHPNFSDAILRELETRLVPRAIRYWPLGLPSLDLNLVTKFIFQKPG